MSEEIKRWQVIKKGIVKTMFWMIAAIFLLLILTIAALQHPYIQTKVVQKVSGILADKIGFPVNINHVNLKWFDILLLKGVEVKDFKGNQMIYIHELSVDFKIAGLLDEKNINIDQVILNGARVNLIRNTDDDDLNINLFIKRIRSLASAKSSSNSKSPIFSIDDVLLEDSYFSLNDPLEDSIKNSFDYYHFEVNAINAKIKDLKIIADTFEIDVSSISGYNPKHDLKINNMETFFRFSESSMEFTNLDLAVGNSIVKDSVVFLYNEISDLNHFNDSVEIVANFDKSLINSKDLAVFAPVIQKYDDNYIISGKFKGKIRKFTMSDFQLKFGVSSSLEGVVSFDGLPDIEESFIEARLTNSTIHTFDVRRYIEEDDYDKIKKFGHVNFSGQFLGFPYDFVANGTFLTDLGKIVSDINLKIEQDSKNTTYQGNLATYNFDLGALLDKSDLVHKITMNGSVNGRGLTLEDAIVNLDAKISSLGINNYNYNNIITNARFAKELFEGKLSIDDPNLKFTTNASIDLRNKQNIFKIDADLDTAILKPLNFTSENAYISSKINLNLQGSEIDNIIGEANFYDALLGYKEKNLQLSFLKINSEKENNSRYISLKSDLVEVDAAGNFDFTVLAEDLKKLVKEYKLNFINNELAINKYYATKTYKDIKKYSLDYSINLKNINPILNLFEDDLYINPNTTVEGNFTSGYTSIFSLRSDIDTVRYNNSDFFKNQIDITSSKIADSTNVLASVYLFSEQQKHSSLAQMEGLTFEGIWNDDHIDFQSSIQQSNTSNRANVYGNIEFLSDRTELKFHDSEFHILENVWEILEENRVVFDDGQILFENLKLFNGGQNIAVNGILSDTLDEKLIVSIEEFQLEMLNPLLQQKFSGIMNGHLDIKNGLGDFILESQMGIKAFKIDNFLVGDITGVSIWDKDLDRLGLTLDVFRVDRKTVDIAGTFTPSNEENQLDLIAKFDQTNLNLIEPFTEGIFSKIKGVASGTINISGLLDAPVLKGTGNIDGGRITIDYLNTHYSFNGSFIFDENEMGLRNLNVYDDNNNVAVVNGGVFHDGFKDFVLDIKTDMNNFKVLNTTNKDNDLYYGTAIVSGNLEVLGDIHNLNFNASATSNKGTKIFIPISNTGGVEHKDFINFVSFSDTLNIKSDNGKEGRRESGIKLNFDLDITPDAYCEIIFDIKSGDIIRGRGIGKINLQIDTNGDFYMFGDYEIQEGGYNFTLYNIINKEFKIQAGSKITWYGDPYHAILDIDAVYEQMASLYPLMPITEVTETATPGGADYKRRYPAKVYLFLNGDLLAPNIDFNIDIVNYNENAPTNVPGTNLGHVVNAFKFRIQADRTELDRQVFSLIILRRFSSENNFSTGNAITSSVSELLSNQLSYWITQVDENLEIDVDLGGLDTDAWNTMQLRLAYTFLDGRLRISRDGGFTNNDNVADINSIAGEWTVEYLLTPDGKLRAKMFNRNNYNLISLGNSTTTGGFSLIRIDSFDNLKELFQKNKVKNAKPDPALVPEDEEEKEEEIITPDLIIKDENKDDDELIEEDKNKRKASIE